MKSLHNKYRNRLIWAVGATLSVAAASVQADSPKPGSTSANVTQPSELMTFANVKVVNPTTISAVAEKRSEAEHGLRAYIDPSTKRLREQTNEDALQIAEESKAKLSAKSANRSRNRSASFTADEGPSEPEMIYGPGNTVGVMVGEEQQVYQVVRKTQTGLSTAEFSGKQAAEKSLKSKVVAEVNHER